MFLCAFCNNEKIPHVFIVCVCMCMRANIIFENGIACMHETNSSNGKIIIYYLCWTCFSMNLLYIFSPFPHSHIIHCYTIFAFTSRIRVPGMPRINNNNIDDDENVNLILETRTQSWRVEAAVWIIGRGVLSLELLTFAICMCVCVCLSFNMLPSTLRCTKKLIPKVARKDVEKPSIFIIIIKNLGFFQATASIACCYRHFLAYLLTIPPHSLSFLHA